MLLISHLVKPAIVIEGVWIHKCCAEISCNIHEYCIVCKHVWALKKGQWRRL